MLHIDSECHRRVTKSIDVNSPVINDLWRYISFKLRSKTRTAIIAVVIVVLLAFAALGTNHYFLNRSGDTTEVGSKGSSQPVPADNSTDQSSMYTVSVQDISLFDHDAPAYTGTTQSNGTVLYIPANTVGGLSFQAFLNGTSGYGGELPQMSVYLNGTTIYCSGAVGVQYLLNTTEYFACMAPVTSVGSSNNVTIVFSSPFISNGTDGTYTYQSMITPIQD